MYCTILLHYKLYDQDYITVTNCIMLYYTVLGVTRYISNALHNIITFVVTTKYEVI